MRKIVYYCDRCNKQEKKLNDVFIENEQRIDYFEVCNDCLEKYKTEYETNFKQVYVINLNKKIYTNV